MVKSNNLAKKVAFVTGASRGLGRATAIALAKAGADVLVGYYQSQDKAREVVELIRMIGRKSEAIQVDISDAKQVKNAATYIFRKYERVDILVNNAGVIIRPGDWRSLRGEALDRTIGVNLKGTIYCIQEFAPKMIENGWGRIINFTSTYAITGAAAVLAYTAAKAGVISITYAMARELGPHGITVNAIAPGNFDTDMARGAGEAVNKWAISTTPLGRLGKPEEIGEAVVFLVNAEFITGHILVVDGGHILNM